MSASNLEERVAIVTGRCSDGGIRSALTLAGAAVASNAALFIMRQTVEINGGWAMH